jgi:2-polyprenyl-6-hydroxyphenyl methylase/3-demethylubiquinone-9 3-methyltransferase
VLDIGSGSGIHSLCFHKLGAARLVSFDVDTASVEATRVLWKAADSPTNWEVHEASILTPDTIKRFSPADVVYAWGVLHHTGDMWRAIENASRMVAPHGHLWIAIYQGGPRYPTHLALKQRYNAASRWGKRWLEAQEIARIMAYRAIHRQNPLTWNEKRARGMNAYNDLIDWLGGLPYEVALEDEVLQFCRARGFTLERIQVKSEGGCSRYLFRRVQIAESSPGSGFLPKD